MAVKKFKPTSSDEGMSFTNKWCRTCTRDSVLNGIKQSDDCYDNERCSIIADTLAFSTDDPEYPEEWIIDENGPHCTSFQRIDLDDINEYIATKIVRPNIESSYTIQYGKNGQLILQEPTRQFNWVVTSLEHAIETALECEAANFPVTFEIFQFMFRDGDKFLMDHVNSSSFEFMVIDLWEKMREWIQRDVRVAWMSAQE